MPGSFSYVVATNIATVIQGTSGSPATCADFVTADRAGTGTFLKTASAPSKTYTLTYPVRPVEFRAIVVKFVVAAKTAEADYLFITGTDAWDAAQTESIDVSAGNGTYTSTKRWRTISNISCSDAADGTGTLWANGTLAVTQDIWGVIWDWGNGRQYKIDCHFIIGDGSTSTYFASELQQIVFNSSPLASIQNRVAATMRLGIYNNGRCYNGSSFIFEGLLPAWSYTWEGTTEIYGSHVIGLYPTGSGCKFRVSGIFKTAWTTYEGPVLGIVPASINASSFYENIRVRTLAVYAYGIGNPTGDHCINFVAQDTNDGLCFVGLGPNVTYSFTGLSVANSTRADVMMGWMDRTTINIIDGTWSGIITWISNYNTNTLNDQKSCNINVADKNGNPLAGVAVDCEDQYGTPCWATGTVITDANGDISQQLITYKRYQKIEPAAAVTTTYSPHKFTISKAEYQTLPLDNITVSSAIKWHLELQPVRQSISASPSLAPLGTKQVGVIS